MDFVGFKANKGLLIPVGRVAVESHFVFLLSDLECDPTMHAGSHDGLIVI